MQRATPDRDRNQPDHNVDNFTELQQMRGCARHLFGREETGDRGECIDTFFA